MHVKRFTLFLSLLLTAYLGMAQEQTEPRFKGPVKGTLFGFSGNLTDFSASLPEIGKVDMGGSLFLWKGLTKNLDFSVRYNGLFSQYIKPAPDYDMRYIHELEGSLHLRALSDDHLFNPFISAGIGAGTYSKSIAPYAPLGLGIQLNLFSETYFFLQGNYRVSLMDSKLDHNTFYSIGVAATIKPAKRREPAAPPAPADTDGDGTPDLTDECPSAPGLAQFNGCPDTDHDGVADKNDQCPGVAGTAKYNGCPVPDKDGDGINDDDDKCPSVAGTAKYDGCPIPDTDGDGVDDETDKCPSVPGTVTNKGCPEVKEEVKKRLSFAATAIQFETGKAVVKKQSYKLLDEIVGILNEYPDYMMTIDGHTDNVGKPAKNLELSRQRAQAVKDYCVNKGIDSDRLQANGYGDTVPKASNKTAKGRARNRRVEMDLKLK
jgi:outer membrane protein OmpA-like peptidoglycan-associated protein